MTPAQEKLLLELALIVARLAPPDDQRTIDRLLQELEDEAFTELEAKVTGESGKDSPKDG